MVQTLYRERVRPSLRFFCVHLELVLEFQAFKRKICGSHCCTHHRRRLATTWGKVGIKTALSDAVLHSKELKQWMLHESTVAISLTASGGMSTNIQA